MKKVLCGLGLAVVGVVVASGAVGLAYGMSVAVRRATLCYNSAECIEGTGKGMQPYLHLFGGSQ